MSRASVLYYGTDKALPERLPLRAGPLDLVFEEGDLRYIRHGSTEILRRVYVAVRDHNWGTAPNVLSNLKIEKAARSFRVTFDVANRLGEIDFRWAAAITGEESGAITFVMDGRAYSTFRRNRIGFSVLHPLRECAGRPCTVEKVDGTVEKGTFPKLVSPNQPFLDIRAIRHEVVPGVAAEVRFEGEVFEMEDHRNWTDASFKTYSTPLRLPFPVEIAEGARIRQSVRLSLSGQLPVQETRPGGGPIMFSFDPERRAPMPPVGLGMASHGRPLSEKELSRLRRLHLSHLRVDLVLSRPDWVDTLRHAAAQAGALDVPLEAALELSDAAPSELAALVPRLQEGKPRVCRWLVFHAREKSTSAVWMRLARNRLAALDPSTKFVAGANAYFAELNRGRPDPSALDAACFSINPQVHAFDNDSLVENLAAQADVLESARQFLGATPVIVTPVTLKPRFNPNATGPAPEPPPGELPPQVDPRQMSLFGACWTAVSLKYLAEGGAASVTCYETTGWRGIMETQHGCPLPERFRSIPGAVFPLYHVLADAGEFSGGEALSSRSSHPLHVDGFVLRKGRRVRALLANFGPELREVRVDAAGLGKSVRVKPLDETNVERAMTAPEGFRREEGSSLAVTGQWLELRLRPYSVLRLDWEQENS